MGSNRVSHIIWMASPLNARHKTSLNCEKAIFWNFEYSASFFYPFVNANQKFWDQQIRKVSIFRTKKSIFWSIFVVKFLNEIFGVHFKNVSSSCLFKIFEKTIFFLFTKLVKIFQNDVPVKHFFKRLAFNLL